MLKLLSNASPALTAVSPVSILKVVVSLKGRQHEINFYLRMLKLLTNASPAVTAVSPVSILKVVVFPAPLTPNRPKHSAPPTPKVSRLTATRPACPSYFFTRFRTLKVTKN
jgi:hypothetical protein